jgi:cell division protein FtsB
VNMTTLEEERAELVALKETLQKYVRQLEQSNDDLERGKRYVCQRARVLVCTSMSLLMQGHYVFTRGF